MWCGLFVVFAGGVDLPVVLWDCDCIGHLCKVSKMECICINRLRFTQSTRLKLKFEGCKASKLMELLYRLYIQPRTLMELAMM